MGEPRIEIHGAEAEEVARELQALLEAEFGERVERLSAQEPGTEDGPTRADPWVVAQVILGIPPAILAVMDIAKRIELTAKVKRILAWTKQRGGAKGRIGLISAKGRSVDLEKAEPGEVVEALVEKDRDA
jgi:hypothetical protein